MLTKLKKVLYQKGDQYLVKTTDKLGLNYREYYLYREDKILLIKKLTLVDTASSLNEKKKNYWYYNCIKIKDIN